MTTSIFTERQDQIYRKGDQPFQMSCNKDSLAGAVSQRACVFCGSRVVLYPIADALHLVHGPIGCAAYTWDIRGALSSGPALHRLSFSTDLQERDVIFGGEEKLERALLELIERHDPKGAFVYSTCIVGIIGDDLEAVCGRVAKKTGIPVLPVQSEGFKGNKRAGYNAACKAMFRLIGTKDTSGISPLSINILGDFNLAGEIWIIREYFERMGVQVVANITGDGRIGDIQRAHGAALNVVQCSGSTMDLALMMKDSYGIPVLRVSYFGIEDMAESLYTVARFFAEQDPLILERTQMLVKKELEGIYPELMRYRQRPSRQESGDLRRRCVQGLFSGQGVSPPRYGCRDGRVSDRYRRGLQGTQRNNRRRDHNRRRFQPSGIVSVPAREGSGHFRGRRKGATDCTQARSRFLRPQS